MSCRSRVLRALAAALIVAGAPARPAGATPWLYVTRAGERPVEAMSQVVVAREGRRAMIVAFPSYRGPAVDFAFIVPVPASVAVGQIRTVPRKVLERLDELSAPRLVELWEQDPCAAPPDGGARARSAEEEEEEEEEEREEKEREEREREEKEKARGAQAGGAATATATATGTATATATGTATATATATGTATATATATERATATGTATATAGAVGAKGRDEDEEKGGGEAPAAMPAEYTLTLPEANDTSALIAWLRSKGYLVPDDVEHLLSPWASRGMRFLVVQVDAKKATFDGETAVLSGLAFDFDTGDLTLPARVDPAPGDLVIYALSRGARLDAADRAGVPIEAERDVDPRVKERFPSFVASLLQTSFAAHPGSPLVEHASDPKRCDACPGRGLEGSDIVALGADRLVPAPPALPPPATDPALRPAVSVKSVSGEAPPNAKEAFGRAESRLLVCHAQELRNTKEPHGDLELTVRIGFGGAVQEVSAEPGSGLPERMVECVKKAVQPLGFSPPGKETASFRATLSFTLVPGPPGFGWLPQIDRPRPNPWGYTLTRLHLRSMDSASGQDLTLREAPSLVPPGAATSQPAGAPEPANGSRFVPRFAIKHPYTGRVWCDHPRRGQWGSEPPGSTGQPAAKPAIARAPEIAAAPVDAALLAPPAPISQSSGGCGRTDSGASGGCSPCNSGSSAGGSNPSAPGSALLAFLGVLVARIARKRR